MIAPLKNIERLAVILPSWVGDCVMATPVYRALRNGLSKAKITGIMRPGLNEILAGSNWFDEMITCDMKGAAGVMRTAQAIRKNRPEGVVLLPNSFKSALAARLSKTKIRIGYARDGRGWLLTHRCQPPSKNSPISAVDYYADLAVFALGVDASAIDHHLELHTTEGERAAADRMLHDVKGAFIVLNPGANRADKRWPAHKFAAVADQLVSSHGLSIVISGSPKERDIVDAVLNAMKHRESAINLLDGSVTLSSLKAVIERAALVITNDTGPRHIAAALGVPVITLFGPTDHRWTTLHGAREKLMLAEPFLPEELMADRYPKACAIDKIAVCDVLHAAKQVLACRLS